jgi:REP element-mobilizing transposase RayT
MRTARRAIPAKDKSSLYFLAGKQRFFHCARMFPERKNLPHGIPPWVANGADYFITICAARRGTNQLCFPDKAQLIRESFEFRQNRGELWAHLLLLMPDHLHAVMSFSPCVGMQKTVADWKRYTGTRGDIRWQCGFFDHRLRNDESYIEKAHYIRMNPVRAGLIRTPEEWPFVWENRPCSKRQGGKR